MQKSLSAFADAKFDKIAWINEIIAQKPDGEGLEAYLASLSMRLHLASEDYTDQLETSMVEVMSSTPRLLSDVNRINDVLKSFEEEMSQVRTRTPTATATPTLTQTPTLTPT